MLRYSSGSEIGQNRTHIIQIFENCRLYIIVKLNLKRVDFTDVSFDLVHNTYQPYRKPNSETVYNHKHSKYPSNSLKELPKANNKQLLDISCNHDIFDAAKSTYIKRSSVAYMQRWFY